MVINNERTKEQHVCNDGRSHRINLAPDFPDLPMGLETDQFPLDTFYTPIEVNGIQNTINHLSHLHGVS